MYTDFEIQTVKYAIEKDCSTTDPGQRFSTVPEQDFIYNFTRI